MKVKRQFRSCAWLILAIFLLLAASFGMCVEPRKSGIIYDCEITSCFFDEDNKITEKNIPAVLLVRFPEEKNASPITSIELDRPKNVFCFKVFKNQMPGELEGIFKNREFFLFSSEQVGGMPGNNTVVLDISGPQLEQATKNVPESLLILDARGNPADGFEVELEGKVYNPKTKKYGSYTISSATLDDTGIFSAPLFRSPRSLFSREYREHRPYNNLKLFVRHPLTDQFQEFRFPIFRFSNGTQKIVDTLYLVIAPDGFVEEGEIGKDIFAGEVVDQEGKPVAHAHIRMSRLNIAGGDQIFNDTTFVSFRTGGSGRFQFVVPKNKLMEKTDQEALPPKSSVKVFVFPPQDPGRKAGKVEYTVYPGKKNRIVLPYAETLVFRFKDDEGAVLKDPVRVTGHSVVELNRVDLDDPVVRKLPYYQKRLHMSGRIGENRDLVIGPVPLPGTYEAIYADRHYHPQKIERGSEGRPIVWTPVKEQLIYKGHVVDIRTGEPVAGAYISLASDQDSPWGHASMPEEDRKRLWADVPNDGTSIFWNKGHIRFSDGRHWFSVLALGRTDANGCYAMAHPFGSKPANINVWAPGMVGISAREFDFLEFNDGFRYGTYEVPDAVLIPSAEVDVHLKAPYMLPDVYLREKPDRTPQSLNFNTIVTYKPSTDWKLPAPLLNPTKQKPWRLIHARTWNKVDTDYTVMVPAGVKFSLFFSNASEDVIKGASWKDLGSLSPGDEMILEPREMELNRPYIVKVLDADGKPAPGQSVRIEGKIPLVTDDAGTLIGWTDGHVSRIEVMSGKGWEVLVKKENITIPKEEGAPVVEIRLP